MKPSDARPFAVVATYKPDKGLTRNVRILAAQARVIIVDDGSPTEYRALLKSQQSDACQVLLGSENKGLAAALNRGVSAAIVAGATHVLTFDQDTTPDVSHVATLLDRLTNLRSSTGHTILGPGSVMGLQYRSKSHRIGDLLFVAEALQSGLCIPVEVFQTIGLFNEAYFIDGVDTEFCLRVRQAGGSVAVVTSLKMDHALGAGMRAPRFRFGPWTPIATGHSSLRRYYMVRNKILLLRQFARNEPAWAAVTIRQLVAGSLLAVTVEDNRAEKAMAITLGLRDGVLGRSGPAASRQVPRSRGDMAV